MSATKNINAEKIQGNLSIDSIIGSSVSATTMSATTIYGGTLFSGTTNLGSIFSTTAHTHSQYATLSGATFTGDVVTPSLSASTLSANTLNVAQYIDFAKQNPAPTNATGRVFFDEIEKSLSYYPDVNNDVSINIGQQEYSRVNNASGTIIPKGSVVTILASLSGTPSVTLAIASGVTSTNITGVAAHDIGIDEEGFILTRGLLTGLEVNDFNVGQVIYLSDTTLGGYIGNTSSLALTSRINKLGYIIQTGTTEGKMFISIMNENSEELLTIKEKNLLVANTLSTGAYIFSGITTASTTSINVAPLSGWIIKNTNEFAETPDTINVLYSGQTGVSVSNILTSDATYLLITSANTLTQQTTFPTPTERRNNIFIGGILHTNRSTIYEIIDKVDYDVSPISQLRDMFVPMNLINQGITAYANGANLNFNTTLGELYGLGINWINDTLDPNTVTIAAKTVASFYYGTRTGVTTTFITSINPNNYDVAGVITAIPTGGDGTSQRSTNQRIYILPDGDLIVLYGQQTYESLALALAGQQTETFIRPSIVSTGAILIGLLAVRRNQTVLNNTSIAMFTPASMFGESVGGVNGISTTTLQQAYNNSTSPEITINATLDGLTILNGTGNADNVTNLLEGKNAAGTTTSLIRSDGLISATTINVGAFTGTSSSVATIQGTGSDYTTSALKIYNSGGTKMYDFMDKGRFIAYDPTGLVSLSLEAQGTTGVSEITSNSTTLIFQTNSGEYSFRRLTAGNILMYTNGKQFDLSATVGGAPNVTIGTNGYFGVGGTPTNLFHVFGDSYLNGGVTANTINISQTSSGTSIASLSIDASGRIITGTTSGEANTVSNLSGGIGLYTQKVGVDLQFKSLTSTGQTLNITSDSNTINLEIGPNGALRTKNSLTTTNNTQTLIGQISGLTSGTYIVESYITANKSLTEYGVWKRTLGVTTTGGTPVIVYESAVLDKVSSGFTGTTILYSGITGNLIDIYVTGVVADTYNWFSYYEVVDEGIAGKISEDYVIKSANYNIGIGNRYIEVTTVSTQTLPSAINLLSKEYRVINASSGLVVVNTTSSQTIGNKVVGNPTSVTLNPEEWLDVQSNGSNWRMV